MEDKTLSSLDRILNVNVGILGHVDSGKTSLVRCISNVLSTAALDKHPQSQARGITLDLGFSCFSLSVNDLKIHPALSSISQELQQKFSNYQQLQYTLVDCPGHYSLIRTIIGAANIINMIILVIDINKGIQSQTSECIILAEIINPVVIVFLNKIDLIPENIRKEKIEKVKNKIIKTFSKTKIANSYIISIGSSLLCNINELISNLLLSTPLSNIKDEEKLSKDKFIMLYDHCFQIKGQGTILTGTVIKGSINTGDSFYFPQLHLEKKVKNIQSFHHNVPKAIMGDRIGLCFSHLESQYHLERGFISAPNQVFISDIFIVSVSPIRFFPSPLKSQQKYHISIGHHTTVGLISFFTQSKTINDDNDISLSLNLQTPYLYIDNLTEYIQENKESLNPIYAIIHLDTPLSIYLSSLYIASKLDSNIQLHQCRLAFNGYVLYSLSSLSSLRLYREKVKYGIVDRIIDKHQIISRGLFHKDVDMNSLKGYNIILTLTTTSLSSLSISNKSQSEMKEGNSQPTIEYQGTILGSFGQNDKFKVFFAKELPVESISGIFPSHISYHYLLGTKKNQLGFPPQYNVSLSFHYKKYQFETSDQKHSIFQ